MKTVAAGPVLVSLPPAVLASSRHEVGGSKLAYVAEAAGVKFDDVLAYVAWSRRPTVAVVAELARFVVQ